MGEAAFIDEMSKLPPQLRSLFTTPGTAGFVLEQNSDENSSGISEKDLKSTKPMFVWSQPSQSSERCVEESLYTSVDSMCNFHFIPLPSEVPQIQVETLSTSFAIENSVKYVAMDELNTLLGSGHLPNRLPLETARNLCALNVEDWKMLLLDADSSSTKTELYTYARNMGIDALLYLLRSCPCRNLSHTILRHMIKNFLQSKELKSQKLPSPRFRLLELTIEAVKLSSYGKRGGKNYHELLDDMDLSKVGASGALFEAQIAEALVLVQENSNSIDLR